MRKDREPGFYWVLWYGDIQPAEFDGNVWTLIGSCSDHKEEHLKILSEQVAIPEDIVALAKQAMSR